MLTMSPPARSPSDGEERSLALRSLGRISLRIAGLGRTVAIVTAGVVPVLITVGRGRSDLSGPLTMLGLVAGAAVGGVADDPAAELMAPCPIAASTRIAARLLVTLATISGGVCTALVVGALGPGVPPGWVDRLPEFAFASTAAVAVGLSVRRRGDPYGAMSGISAGLIVPLTVAALAFRWPAHLPGLSSSPIHDRWWYLAATAFVLSCHAGRDVARPTLFTWRKGSSR